MLHALLLCLLRDVLELRACGAQHDVVTETIAIVGRQVVPEEPQPRLGFDLQATSQLCDDIQTTCNCSEAAAAASVA